MSLHETEGAGKAGCPPHPWSACNKKHAAEPQVQADHPAFPAQWFYGLYVISPVTGLFCHRHLRVVSRKLSASVGAPGPHDFAVRRNVARLVDTAASIASHPHVRDDAYAPLAEAGPRKKLPNEGSMKTHYFCAPDSTTPIHLHR